MFFDIESQFVRFLTVHKNRKKIDPELNKIIVSICLKENVLTQKITQLLN